MKTLTTKTALFCLIAATASFLGACDGNTGTGGTGGTGGGTGGTGGSTGGTGGTVEGKPDGDPCAANDECAGGFCLTLADFGFPNGYCTGACNAFVPCALGSECIYYQNEPFCFKACADMGGCGDAQQCLEIDPDSGLSVCAPGCTMDSQCEGYGICDETSGFCAIPEDCNAAGDEDGDGLFDCEDADCATSCQAQVDAACGAATGINLQVGVPVQTNGDSSDGSQLMAGTCSGSGNKEEIFKVTAPADVEGILELALQSAQDLAVYVRSSCNMPSELGCTDALAGGADPEVLNLSIGKGESLYVFVDGSSFGGATGNEGAYTLSTTLIGVQSESEANNDEASADPVNITALPTAAVGDLDQATDDDDWWLIDTSALAGNNTIRAETVGYGGDSCAPNGDVDTYLEIVAAGGMLIDPVDPNDPGPNDDISGFTNWCSLAEATGLAPGKYYLHIKTSSLCIPDPAGPDCIFKYGIKISIQ
ncbi:MAG: hypothetical protein IPK82_19700 [Polyangiaceae bacterium]|nr:hypothetical protein [Polyangiaceae bacterium]